MTIESGVLEQAYVDEEAAYGVPDSLSATDGIRHLELMLTSKKNAEASPVKRGTPDHFQSLARRQTTGFDLPSIMWEPSGSVGTISNVGKLIEGAMGSKNVATLVTTVASGASATGAVLTSGTGIVVGALVSVEMPAGHREVTRIKTIATATVTWDSLSTTPDVGADVICGVSYIPTSSIAKSYSIYRYLLAGGHEQAVYGAVVNRIQVTFDGTKEVMLAFSGPAASYADSTYGTVQAKPASHTTVGDPIGGMVGNVRIDTATLLVIGAQVELTNALELRNKELGTSVASGIAGRTVHRDIKVTLNIYMEDTSLITKANNRTRAVVRLLVGQANGSQVGCVMPSVEFEIPDIPSGTGPLELTIEGKAYATSGNDSIFLGEM